MNAYIFADCAKQPITRELCKFRENQDVLGYFAAFTLLLEFSRTKGVTEHTVREYCVRMLLNTPKAGEYFCDRELSPYIEKDLALLYQLYFGCDWRACCASNEILPPPKGAAQGMPDDYRFIMEGMVESESPQDLRDRMTAFFRTYSDELEAVYTAFRWNGKSLEGISQPESVSFDQLGGLSFQKRILRQNTAAFLAGKPASDILLTGASGTGRSSCIKAVLNQFRGEGLRLVEVPGCALDSLPQLMQLLRKKKLRYALYVDHLPTAPTDAGYRGLAHALDGQIEERPGNVIVYAVSNRRELVRDNSAQSSKEGADSEAQTSLAERFGIRLFFSTLSQTEYFAVVELLLQRKGVPYDESVAHSASAWAAANNSHSGRSAKQFVNQYLSQ